MGKVEKLYMGRDNRVRRCLLKVVSKTSLVKLINRPIKKLCPLEIREGQFEDNPNIIYKQGVWPKREAAIRGILKRIESGEWVWLFPQPRWGSVEKETGKEFLWRLERVGCSHPFYCFLYIFYLSREIEYLKRRRVLKYFKKNLRVLILEFYPYFSHCMLHWLLRTVLLCYSEYSIILT